MRYHTRMCLLEPVVAYHLGQQPFAPSRQPSFEARSGLRSRVSPFAANDELGSMDFCRKPEGGARRVGSQALAPSPRPPSPTSPSPSGHLLSSSPLSLPPTTELLEFKFSDHTPGDQDDDESVARVARLGVERKRRAVWDRSGEEDELDLGS